MLEGRGPARAGRRGGPQGHRGRRASTGLARTSGALLAINLAEPLISLGRWDEALEVIEHALRALPAAG